MKILFEEHEYKTEDVKDILGDFLLRGLDLRNAKQRLKYVGYYFNNNIEHPDGSRGDLVFILPKVLLDSKEVDGKRVDTAFGMAPEKVMNFNFEEWKKGGGDRRKVYDFIYGFATWIYRAVDIYRRNQKGRKPSEGDDEEEELEAEVMSSVKVGKSGRIRQATFVDVMLSLLDFQREHKNFITFVMKTAHSGYNKISWSKTIAKTQPFVQDGVPLYLHPVNKKRVVNFDEELLVIYYSILNYMHAEYGFPMVDQPGYKLITGKQFDGYRDKKLGVTRLRQIRYKYYSDEALLLWNLCYAFFDMSDNLKAGTRDDYMLVGSFHCVFEAMIDELIGDKDLPKNLKEQADDKRIDHLYTYKYLLENMDKEVDSELGKERKIYHIADSKYYKRSRNEAESGHDVPKQFTYVRNVLQWHMDLLNEIINDKDALEYADIQLYDEVTEGFNVVPNFFISAKVDDDLSYESDRLQPTRLGGKTVHESFFFWERLFDRNTFFTLHYDLNFLYVLKKYAQNKSYEKAAWKLTVRRKFRAQVLDHLNQEFEFYQIVTPDIRGFVDKYYRQLQGKVFSFETSEGKVLLYAERRANSPDDKQKRMKHSSGRALIGNDGIVIPLTGDTTVTIRNNARKIRTDEEFYPYIVSKKLGEDGYEIVLQRTQLTLSLVGQNTKEHALPDERKAMLMEAADVKGNHQDEAVDHSHIVDFSKDKKI